MRVGILAILTLGVGCTGSFTDPGGRGGDDDPGDGKFDTSAPACPTDPDCAIGGDCTQYVCPEYWECEDIVDMDAGKRCINPGPEYPDNSGNWTCEDRDGVTHCRGTTYPDSSSSGEWNCRMSGEFVDCEDDSPTYPDVESDEPWNCHYEGEFRVCETGGTSTGGGDTGWTCYEGTHGQVCRQSNPGYPDDREWDCYDILNTDNPRTVCRATGDDLPSGDSGSENQWNCEQGGEFVQCEDESPSYPDGGGDAEWDCYYSGEFRVCTSDSGDDNPPEMSECVPGQQRWCDDRVYCSWGKQTCLPDGSWGSCVEPVHADGNLLDRPNNSCACRHALFYAECCEDQEDRDHDGEPDCLIPDNHDAPNCEYTGELCSYCDSDDDCGENNKCVLDHNHGNAQFCGRDCTSSGCPSGYTCAVIGRRMYHQCVPDSGMCE